MNVSALSWCSSFGMNKLKKLWNNSFNNSIYCPIKRHSYSYEFYFTQSASLLLNQFYFSQSVIQSIQTIFCFCFYTYVKSSFCFFVTSHTKHILSNGNSFFRAVLCIIAVKSDCGLKNPANQTTEGSWKFFPPEQFFV